VSGREESGSSRNSLEAISVFGSTKALDGYISSHYSQNIP